MPSLTSTLPLLLLLLLPLTTLAHESSLSPRMQRLPTSLRARSSHHQHLARHFQPALSKPKSQHHRRQTAAQTAQASALSAWNADFQALNAQWQAAAVQSQKEGKVPLSFEEFAKSHGGVQQVPDLDKVGKAAEAEEEKSGSSDGSSLQAESDDDEQQSQQQQPAEAQAQAEAEEDKPSPKAAAPKANKPVSSHPKPNNPAPQEPQQQQQQQADSAPSSSSSGPTTGAFSGKATFYSPSVGFGSCGAVHSDSEFIIALNTAQMTSNWPGNPNLNPLCNRKIKLWHNGKQAEAKITDTCPGCEQKGQSVDMSPALFDYLASEQERTVAQSFNVEWAFA